MISADTDNKPLISVIIPCYNHGAYLGNAINSIYGQQGYASYEIIVVDDGSADDTREVALAFPGVRYIYQQNAGLSAARNTGIKYSNGQFLLFLDADDWLLPDAMATNYSYLKDHEEIAFVSGAYAKFFVKENLLIDIKKEVVSDHYCTFLEGNYIGMHAAVLYRRRLFDNLAFDESLKACEDYDLYLKIARHYPVVHHTKVLTVYRIHDTNMSGNPVLMVNYALKVLERQKPFLRTDAEWQCYRNGLQFLKGYYGQELYERLRYQLNHSVVNKEEHRALKALDANLYSSFTRELNKRKIKGFVKRLLPSFMLKKPDSKNA